MRKVLAAAAILAACTTAPVTGRKQLNLVGDSTINQLGVQAYQQEIGKAKKDTDPAHVEMVQRVSKRLADTAEAQFHPGYQWETTVIDDPKPPAFLSDHPSDEQRIADIQRELPEAEAAFVAHR